MIVRHGFRYYLIVFAGFLCASGFVFYATDLFQLLTVSNGFTIFICCLLLFGLFISIHRKNVLLPFLSIVFLLLSSLMLFFDGVMQKFYHFGADFGIWFSLLIRLKAPLDLSFETFLLSLLIILAGLFFYVFSAGFNAPFVLITGLCFFVILPGFLLKNLQPNLPFLIPCALGIALLLSLSAKEEKECERLHLPISRRYIAFAGIACLAIICAIAASVLIHSFYPSDKMTSRPFIRSINQVNTLFKPSKKPSSSDSSESSLYDSSTMGLCTFDRTLGGEFIPSGEVIMQVTAPHDLLLKGRIFDKYSTSYWDSQNDSFSLPFELPKDVQYSIINSPDAFLSSAYQNTVPTIYQNSVLSSMFDSFRPSSSNIPFEYCDLILAQYDIVIKVASNNTGTSLFYPDHLVDADFFSTIYYDEDSCLYADEAVPIGKEYQIRSNIFRMDVSGFDNSLLLVEQYLFQNISGNAYSFVHSEKIRADYLETNVPDSVIQYALKITKGYTTPLEKAIALRNHLRNNFQYSLQVPDVPEGVDFVEHFLDTKTGYCTYFASAMCMMARANGIPARYVEGFYVDVPDGGLDTFSTVLVTGKSAHAWCEIYIDGIGWIPFDATPGMGIVPSEITITPTSLPTASPTPVPAETAPEPSESETTPTPTPTPEPAIAQTDPSETGSNLPLESPDTFWNKLLSLLPLVLGLAAIVILLSAPFVCLHLYRKKRYFSIPTSDKLDEIGSPEDVLLFLYRRCLIHLNLADIRILSNESPQDFASRIQSVQISARGCRTGLFSFDIQFISNTYEKMIYGLISPEEDEIILSWQECMKLSSRVRSIHRSAVHYFLNGLSKRLQHK